MAKYPTTERLRSLLDYDAATGVFTWKVRRKSGYPGQRAGHVMGSTGYYGIGIDGHKFLSHRLAWIFVYGYTPESLDHINGNPLDNRIANLRLANPAQSSWNRKKRTCPNRYKGVRRANKKWQAQITVYGKRINLGVFETEQAAYQAYCCAAKELHGEFARLA